MKNSQKYIGIKLIDAKPMTRLEYNQLRGWTVPENENPNDEGYLTQSEGFSNMVGFSGYVQWLPKDQFEKEYRSIDNLTFGLAIEALKRGEKVARAGWNGKGMHLEIQNPDERSKMTHPYLFMTIPECKEGTRRLPWQPAQVDLFAEDWQIV